MSHGEFANIPKVELHIHLEAFISYDLVKAWHGIDEADRFFYWLAKVRRSGALSRFNVFVMAFRGLAGYLNTFEHLRELMLTAIQRQKQMNVVYSEFTFTPSFFLNKMGWSISDQSSVLSEVVDENNRNQMHKAFVLMDIAEDTPIKVAEEILCCVERLRNNGIVGLNFSSDDRNSSILRYVNILREARRQCIPLTLHLGEFRDSDECINLMRLIMPQRIGHGVTLGRSKSALHFLKKNGIAVELCLTSNLISGAIPNVSLFPVREFMDSGVSISINTDDPEIFGISLEDEYRNYLSATLIKKSELQIINMNAVQSGFARF